MKKNIIFIPAIDVVGVDITHTSIVFSLGKIGLTKNNAEVVVWDTPLYTWEEMTIP